MAGNHPKKAEQRPNARRFKTPKDLEDKILTYFKQCEDKKDAPTKAGLRVFLSITKDVYFDYKKRYPITVKKFEDITEDHWNQRLTGAHATGPIFYLKNAFKEDYKDRITNEVPGMTSLTEAIRKAKQAREQGKI